ncbi:MAG: ATP-binding protein [Bryobacteraceae bacterium]|nr:ATP-binding protein [Bryobacteraceae bacterium]
MNSLFSKILVWLVLTAVVTGVGLLVVGHRWADPEAEGPWPPARIVQFYADEAAYAWTEGGDQELAAFLRRLRKTTRYEAHLVDEAGFDVLDGSDHSAAVSRLRRGRLFTIAHGRGLAAGRSTSDGRAFLLIYADGGESLFVRRHLWVLGSAMLLSYLLARHLAGPLRQMEAASERLGRGDLEVRVPEGRSDELGRLAVSFNRMAARIQSLLGAQQRLLLDVSHELRSPLTRLAVAAELAKSSADPKPELECIQHEVDRLNSLVSSLLQVSRVEADPTRLKREAVDLDALLADVADTCRIEAAGCAIEVAGEGGVVKGDAELLRRAVENVIRNAIRYSPPNGRIEVSLSRTASAVRAAIRDHGPGVPEQSLPLLFETFYRVDGQQSGGHGLGLSISRRAVELHGGRIAARNAQPGLEVEITLPA